MGQHVSSRCVYTGERSLATTWRISASPQTKNGKHFKRTSDWNREESPTNVVSRQRTGRKSRKPLVFNKEISSTLSLPFLPPASQVYVHVTRETAVRCTQFFSCVTTDEGQKSGQASHRLPQLPRYEGEASDRPRETEKKAKDSKKKKDLSCTRIRERKRSAPLHAHIQAHGHPDCSSPLFSAEISFPHVCGGREKANCGNLEKGVKKTILLRLEKEPGRRNAKKWCPRNTRISPGRLLLLLVCSCVRRKKRRRKQKPKQTEWRQRRLNR